MAIYYNLKTGPLAFRLLTTKWPITTQRSSCPPILFATTVSFSGLTHQVFYRSFLQKIINIDKKKIKDPNLLGNNWGICQDGSGALGCGPQETFVNCADVAIRPAIARKWKRCNQHGWSLSPLRLMYLIKSLTFGLMMQLFCSPVSVSVIDWC